MNKRQAKAEAYLLAAQLLEHQEVWGIWEDEDNMRMVEAALLEIAQSLRKRAERMGVYSTKETA